MIPVAEQEPDLNDQKTMSQLIDDIGTWATRNFTDHAPVLGIVEEIGEVCHGVLKHLQRIRGFEDAVKFHAHLKDSFADIAIYLCHLAYMKRAFFAFNRNLVGPPSLSPDRVEYHVISHVLQCVSSLCNQETREMSNANEEITLYNLYCQRLCSGLELWASLYEIDLGKATHETWNKIVVKRDWRKDNLEGGGHKHD